MNANDYDTLRNKVHNGDFLMENGKKYSECTPEEQEEFDSAIDRLKQKQETEEKQEAEKDQSEFERYRQDAREKVKVNGVSYEDLPDDQKKQFDDIFEQRYNEFKKKNGGGDSDTTDTEQAANLTREHEVPKKEKEDDEEYCR